MARGRRTARRLLAAAVAFAAAAFAFAAWGDRRPARELLPDGAACAVEVRGAGDLLDRLAATRFAAAFVAGPTYGWLERSEAARAIDELRGAIGRATGFTPRRRHILDLVGSDAAVAWYPGRGGPAAATATPWLAAGRLSLRAWVLASAARAAVRFGLAGSGISRERVAGSTALTIGPGDDALHLLAAGRLVVASNDRELLRAAASLAAGDGSGLTGGEGWRRVAAALPGDGALRLVLSGERIPLWAAAPAGPAVRSAGVVVSVGDPVLIDVLLDVPGPGRQPPDRRAPPAALALSGPAPLFSHASAATLPPPLADLLEARAAAVARRDGTAGRSQLALGRGFALAITSVDEGGLFPQPHGILAIGMRDPDAARQALGLLFPAAARSAPGRWGTALSTRESVPLAGEFELWGAAAGDRLVLATRQSLLESLESRGAPGDGPAAALPEGLVPDSLSALDVARFLPAARRYAPPLAGLLRARLRGLPDVSPDIGLLAAVRTLRVASGATAAGNRARVTLEVGDLPLPR